MPSHVDTGSPADKKAAQEGRKFKGRIYNTLAQKRQAQVAASSYQINAMTAVAANVSGSAAVKTSNWTKHEAVHQFEVVGTTTADTYRRGLLKGSGFQILEPALGGDNVKVTSVRIRLTMGLGHKLRWAAALVSNDADAGKTPAQVASVTGAVASHEENVLAGLWTLSLSGLVAMRTPGQGMEPNLGLYLSVESVLQDDALKSTFTIEVSYLLPEGAANSHIL